jgi:8-oxo-dGTP pyrophosphatase MutT (NUDIX family)
MQMKLSHILFKIMPPWMSQKLLRLKRSMTLGARVAVIDGQGRFLLVKQSYAPGWLFPGGGVEPGETCEFAALRELYEEAEVTPTGPLQLHGIFSNHEKFPGDHLVVYVLRDFAWNGFKPTSEILEARFFSSNELPVDVQESTGRRIAELTGAMGQSAMW